MVSRTAYSRPVDSDEPLP